MLLCYNGESDNKDPVGFPEAYKHSRNNNL
jgi:hypothetical protein